MLSFLLNVILLKTLLHDSKIRHFISFRFFGPTTILIQISFSQRPYHVESTQSRQILEVTQRRARSVLGWVTAWEHRCWHFLIIVIFFSLFPSKIIFQNKLVSLF